MSENSNKVQSSKTNYIIAISTAVFMALAFASAGILQTDTTIKLKNIGIDDCLLSMIPDAFHHFFLLLPVAAFLSIGTSFLDKTLINSKSLPKKSIFYICSAISFSLCWIVLTRTLQFPICGDDSYIDFRYVQNWINNLSFDYNPGERVIGFTSHIHLLLLYIVALIVRVDELSILSQIININFQLLNCCLLYFFLKDVFKYRSCGLTAMFVYAFNPYGIQQTTFGKESHLLVCFLILCLWSMHHKRHHLVAWLSSLIPFIRPEGVVWWLICLIWSTLQNKTKTIKFYIGPMIFVGSILMALYMYFGTIIPHGMIGKFKMLYPMVPLSMLVTTMFMIGTGVIVPKFYLETPASAYVFGAFFIAIASLIYCYDSIKVKFIKWYLYAVIAFIIIYAVKNPAPFQWYLCWFSLVPVFMLAYILPKCFSGKLSGNKKLIATTFGIYLIAVQFSQQFMRPRFDLTACTFEWKNEFKRIVQFGYALDEIKKYPNWKTATIGTPEIGYIGYKHPGKILDFVGLVSPQVVRIGRLPDQYRAQDEILDINPEIVRTFKPDYIITLEAFGRELPKDEFFLEHYKKIAEYDNTWANSKGIYLYKLIK